MYTLKNYDMIKRIDVNGTRYYTKDSEVALSVTEFTKKVTPTSPHLLRWYAEHGYDEAKKRMQYAAAKGTAMHYCFDLLVRNVTVDKPTIESLYEQAHDEDNLTLDKAKAKEDLIFLQKSILSFLQFIEDKKVSFHASELPVFSNKLWLAGTIDLPCELDFNRQRVRAIVDYKSGGIYDSHALQLEAYRRILNETTLEENKYTMIFNWAPVDFRLSSKTASYKLENQTAHAYATSFHNFWLLARSLGILETPTEVVSLKDDFEYTINTKPLLSNHIKTEKI